MGKRKHYLHSLSQLEMYTFRKNHYKHKQENPSSDFQAWRMISYVVAFCMTSIYNVRILLKFPLIIAPLDLNRVFLFNI